MKICYKCKIEKSLEEFVIDKRRENGRGYECIECKRVRSKKYRAEGREKDYWQNSEVKKRKKEWNAKDYEENKELYGQRTKKWINNNYKRHRKYQTAYTASYRAYKKQATPSWAKVEELFEFYKNCPENMEVDHVIPLNHPDVCGLHLPSNMQYLTRTENAVKNNQWDGTAENESWRLKLPKE